MSKNIEGLINSPINAEAKESRHLSKFNRLTEGIFSIEDLKVIKEALSLAQNIHNDQEQIDGAPYIDHVLEVANLAMESFNVRDKDIVITALLHDSIEDQSMNLFTIYANKLFVDKGSMKDGNKKISIQSEPFNLSKFALREVDNRFGDRVSTAVSSLSKPDLNKLVEPLSSKISSEGFEMSKQEIKDNLYRDYFRSILNSGNNDVVIVKLADLLNNVSKNHLLADGPRKEKLKNKYSPVIKEVVIPFLDNADLVIREDCDIDKIMQRFQSIYQRDFELAA